MDVWEYFASKHKEIAEASLAVDDGFLFAEENGSGGQRGRLWGRIIISERAFLQVSERVVVVGSGIHRDEYAYYFVRDGSELWGYERDPTHDEPEHRHDRDHRRFACEPISFKEALEKAWETESQEESWEEPGEEPGEEPE